MSYYKVAFDVEGPVTNPGQDHAKDVMTYFLERKLIDQEFHDLVLDTFDFIDDEQWREDRFSRDVRLRWSTGTMPSVVQLTAAMVGATDQDLYEIAKDRIVENDGILELFSKLQKRGLEIYLVTSAYAAAALEIGRKYGIPSSRIFTSGQRLSPEKLTRFDTTPDPESEIGERSVIPQLTEYRDALKDWLTRYLRLSKELKEAYETGTGVDVNSVRTRISVLFKHGNYSPAFLGLVEYILQSQYVTMGAHRKAEALQQIGGVPVYTGDGIVDADPLLYANASGGLGIAINCTSREALHSSAINLVTPTAEALYPLIKAVVAGRFYPEALSHELDDYEARLFTAYDIRNDFDDVLDANRKVKDSLKQKYREIGVQKGFSF